MVAMKASEKISEFVNSHNIKIESIAEETSIPKADLQKMFNGEKRIKAEDFLIIIQALKMPLSDFLEN